MQSLSRRERQILDILYRVGRASAAEIQTELADGSSNSAIRTFLRILKEKGHIRHESDGPRYVYLPTVSAQKARTSALRHLLNTFFEGSAAAAAAALVDGSKMSEEELSKLEALIRTHKEKKS